MEITFRNNRNANGQMVHAAFYHGDPANGDVIGQVKGYQGFGQTGTVDLPTNQTYWVTVICNNIGPDPAGTVLASKDGLRVPPNTMVVFTEAKTLEFY